MAKKKSPIGLLEIPVHLSCKYCKHDVEVALTRLEKGSNPLCKSCSREILLSADERQELTKQHGMRINALRSQF